MNIEVNGAYIYFVIPIFGGIPVTQTTVSLLVVTGALMLACYFLGRNLQKRPGKLQVLVEKGVSLMHGMVCDTMGRHNAGWTPYIITIFMSSICGSYIGMLGFFRSSTADLSVPLTWGIMTSAIIWYQSIKRNGFLRWLKGFTEPVAVMTPMNLISEIAQPVSMAFRHYGNVFGGSVINLIIYEALALASAGLMNLIGGTVFLPILMLALGIALAVLGRKRQKKSMVTVGIILSILALVGLLEATGVFTELPILQFGIPAVLSIYFDVFSGFVQAFVFTLLSMVYIASACPSAEEA